MNPILQNLLEDLNQSLNEIQAVMLFTIDGIVIASTLEDEKIIDETGAVTAAMQQLGIRSTTLLKRGELAQIQIHANNGYIILNGINNELVLVLLAQKQINMGLILHEIKRTQIALLEQLA
ncbi:roadblock/LC7 domain-containing protein [Suttonella ornithocola]|uniref:Roadblock/LC7 domain n=1 Tax=Suttonella ornithocola TaxID=279832 RepID=A0A380MMU3_9GAMM|nr:roadblock/LC7 domain-containing protein [Suttonella ornithocola]SUO93494.1 Roadblock/LC7 domain [Suttonella ornithocola]